MSDKPISDLRRRMIADYQDKLRRLFRSGCRARYGSIGLLKRFQAVRPQGLSVVTLAHGYRTCQRRDNGKFRLLAPVR